MHEIPIAATAGQQFKRLAAESRDHVSRAVKSLSNDPMPSGCRKLTAHNDVFRVRVGRLRILKSVGQSELEVTVLNISDRNSVYR